MKLDFDVDSIRNNKIELLDCQIDLILRSLEFYCYTYEFIYPRTNKSKSTEDIKLLINMKNLKSKIQL